MKLIELSLPLLGVILGALIAGIGAIWKARVERRKLIACALADLLEVRHHLLAFHVVLREMKKRFDLPNDFSRVLRAFVRNAFPLDPETHTRYSAALSVLAGIDPVLAFRMRSRDSAPRLLEILNELSTSSGVAPAEYESIEVALQGLVRPSIDEAVLELADHHSWSTKRKVQQVVAQADEPPPELLAWLEQAKSAGAKPAG